MRELFTIILFVSFYVPVFSQEDVKALQKANKLYRQKQFDLSLPEYRKAVTINPDNAVAQYNLGNVLFRKEQWADAELTYNTVIEKAKTIAAKEKAVYNKGVSFSRQKKLEESIGAYKNALKLDPNDEDARVNLQKALNELKKQQSGSSSRKQQQKQQPKQQPKQNQSKLNKKQVEQLLKALRQKEQEVQQKMQQQKSRTTSNPEKDW